MEHFEVLLQLAKRKFIYDKTNPWAEGSKTYLNEIRKELDEVDSELKEDRISFLEDELGDVLWDYLNILLTLENEKGITINSVIKRACKKYSERVSGIEKGILWKTIKEQQKNELLLDQENINREKSR